MPSPLPPGAPDPVPPAPSDDVLDAINVSAGKQLGADVYAIEPDQNLFDLGLTSIGFISMIVEFEQRYGVVFEEDDLDLTLFATLDAIRAQLDKKRTGSAAAAPAAAPAAEAEAGAPAAPGGT